MSKKNSYAQQIEQHVNRAILASRALETGFCCDIAQIALGRLGWGEKRLVEFERAFSEAYEEYDKLRTEDGCNDREAVYYKAVVDRELKRYTGSRFLPYEERHGVKKGV